MIRFNFFRGYVFFKTWLAKYLSVILKFGKMSKMCARASSKRHYPTSVIFGDLGSVSENILLGWSWTTHGNSRDSSKPSVNFRGKNIRNKNKERKDFLHKELLSWKTNRPQGLLVQSNTRWQPVVQGVIVRCRHYLINMTSFSQSRVSTDCVASVWRQNDMATRKLSFPEVVKACVSKRFDLLTSQE